MVTENELNDILLLNLLKADDEKAFKYIFDRYFSPLCICKESAGSRRNGSGYIYVCLGKPGWGCVKTKMFPPKSCRL